jgi:hypothetical protein
MKALIGDLLEYSEEQKIPIEDQIKYPDRGKYFTTMLMMQNGCSKKRNIRWYSYFQI